MMYLYFKMLKKGGGNVFYNEKLENEENSDVVAERDNGSNRRINNEGAACCW